MSRKQQKQDIELWKLESKRRETARTKRCIEDVPAAEVATDCLGQPVSVPAPTGTAQLSWNAPTTRTDGSPFENLAGYRIKYGMSPDELPCLIEIRDPKVTTWKVTGLSPGTWYFAVASFDSGFVESELSGVVSKRID